MYLDKYKAKIQRIKTLQDRQSTTQDILIRDAETQPKLVQKRAVELRKSLRFSRNSGRAERSYRFRSEVFVQEGELLCKSGYVSKSPAMGSIFPLTPLHPNRSPLPPHFSPDALVPLWSLTKDYQAVTILRVISNINSNVWRTPRCL
jgi:hypothetical protein